MMSVCLQLAGLWEGGPTLFKFYFSRSLFQKSFVRFRYYFQVSVTIFSCVPCRASKMRSHACSRAL